MKINGARRGFSLVELLAVVLILAVLAAVAVPLYLNTRKTSAARACKGNINAIASAEAAYALRNGVYVDMGTLVTAAPEGLSTTVVCPLNNTNYLINTDGATGTASFSGTKTTSIYVVCPNAGTHNTDLGSGGGVTAWERNMTAIGSDTQP